MLSDRQIWFFRQAGFFRLEQVLESRLVEEVIQTIEAEASHGRPPLEHNGAGAVLKISDLLGRDPLFERLLTSDDLLGPVSSLVGPNIELLRNRHNHATFNTERTSAGRLHRDVMQWARTVVTVIIYLDDSVAPGDCTHVVPGSHFLPFIDTPNNGGTWMDEHDVFEDLRGQAVPVPVCAGGLLLLNGVTFHGAGPRPAAERRLSITAAYQPVDELSPDDDPLGYRVLVRGERLYRGNLP